MTQWSICHPHPPRTLNLSWTLISLICCSGFTTIKLFSTWRRRHSWRLAPANDSWDQSVKPKCKPKCKHTNTFKYLGVVLDDTLSFNDHVDYVRMKVSKILGMLSRTRPSLTLEAANRLYKAMVLLVIDYCDAVWHECGQGNSDKIEWLQRCLKTINWSNYDQTALGTSLL